MIKQLEPLNLRGSPPLREAVWLWSFSFSDAPKGNKTSLHSAEVLCNPQGTGKMNFLKPEEPSEMMWDLTGHWWLRVKPLEVMLMF